MRFLNKRLGKAANIYSYDGKHKVLRLHLYSATIAIIKCYVGQLN